MDSSDTNRVLIAGGGVAALEAALALQALAQGRVTVELVAPEPLFWYRPMAVAEPFRLGRVRHFELSALAGEAGSTFTPGTLVSVDVRRHRAYLHNGGVVGYSMLLIACGAVPKPAVEGALTFRGPADTEAIERLLRDIEAGHVRRVAFAVPGGAVWSLPVYELALLTAAWLHTRHMRDVELAIVTPESDPLHLFGAEASRAVRELLSERGIALHTSSLPAAARDGELLLVGDGMVVADRVVALARLRGARIGGIPQTFEGFIPVDEHGRVMGLEDVYAAGDITTFSVKQGGIAAQQADAAAEAIAAAAGAELEPRPFTPVLRGVLLTGGGPRYLRGEITDREEVSVASTEPLWWPPSKIVGRYLAPFLAQRVSTGAPPDEAGAAPEGAVPVHVPLDPHATERPDRALEALLGDVLPDSDETVATVMSTDPLVVAPEDTLGEVAEKMRERDIGSALVAEYGRLIGIITSRDMLRALAGRVHSSEARVREWMTADPITVTPTTARELAAFLMADHGIHHLPVVEGERPVGMVAMHDIVRAGVRLGAGIGLGL